MTLLDQFQQVHTVLKKTFIKYKLKPGLPQGALPLTYANGPNKHYPTN